MLIFIDTNIFYDNWMLKSAYFQLLSQVVNLTDFQLLISEVVLLETENKFNVESEKIKLDVVNLSQKVEEFWETPFPIDLTPLNSGKYDFKKLVMTNFPNTVWIPITGLDNSRLISKAISCKRPFKDNEKGYRDAVIWETFIQYIKSNDVKDEVAFITGNKSDFLDLDIKTSQFHPDLLDEIIELDIKTKIIPYLSLKEFIGQKVYAHLHQNVESVEEIFGDDIERQFQNHAVSYINNLSMTELANILSGAGLSIKISSLFKSFSYDFMEGVEDPNIHNLYKISDETLSFEYTFNIRGGAFEVTMNTSDYFSAQLDSNKNFFNPNIDGLTTQVTFFGRLYFSASGVLDLGKKTIEQINYDSVAMLPGY